ncbi:hypothetical protein PAXINDRAFT_7041 [Paxillus involutus ATCC 200175]|nr:hypothetical protein PAXINDRAFT_7041 [Paxillus involutus ATCC 200175]
MAPTQMEEEDPFTDDRDEEAQTDEDRSEDDQDNEATASDFEEMMRVLNIPGPSAEVADLQKALALAQSMGDEEEATFNHLCCSSLDMQACVWQKHET